MLKLVGFVCVLGGTAGILYSWVCEQKRQQEQIEDFIVFLQKSIYVMSLEKIKIVDYLERYIEENTQRDESFLRIFKEIIKGLSSNTYPNGYGVWEDCFQKEKESFRLNQEVFEIIVQAGNGFFGRSRAENISFLQKSLEKLELEKERLKKKSLQERKVWIPVGMLGSLMLVILLL